MSLFRDNMIIFFSDDIVIHVENPKESTQNCRTNNYGKFAGYKVNIQKSTAIFYTSNEQMEFEIKNIIPFILVLQKLKQV